MYDLQTSILCRAPFHRVNRDLSCVLLRRICEGLFFECLVEFPSKNLRPSFQKYYTYFYLFCVGWRAVCAIACVWNIRG